MGWSSYEQAKQETDGKTLDPLKIKGETFLFPAVPPAPFGLELMVLIQKHAGRIPDTEAIGLLPMLIGEGQMDALKRATTFPELLGIFDDLLRQYGFTEEGENPNPEAGQTSDEQSSVSLAR